MGGENVYLSQKCTFSQYILPTSHLSQIECQVPILAQNTAFVTTSCNDLKLHTSAKQGVKSQIQAEKQSQMWRFESSYFSQKVRHVHFALKKQFQLQIALSTQNYTFYPNYKKNVCFSSKTKFLLPQNPKTLCLIRKRR